MDAIDVINRFIEFKNYYESGVLGIIFYGSRKYNTAKEDSDIDLLIITDKNKNYKGVTYIDGVRVEYFEKGYEHLLGKVDSQAFSPDRSLESIFKNGEIIYSEDYLVEALRDEVLMGGRIISKRSGDFSCVNDWKEIFDRVPGNNSFSKFVYHNFIENIRKVYIQKNGFDDTGSFKTYNLYNDPKYASKYYCLRLPSLEFRTLFLKAMEEDFSEDKVFQLMEQIGIGESSLWNYTRSYGQGQLKYMSTIVASNVDRTISAISDESPAANHYYYLALDKVRRLYCSINGIDQSMSKFGEGYSEEFLGLFNKCLEKEDKADSIKEIFDFVTKPLNIDYHDYKVLEYSK